ncbi:hypothetical protein BH23CHL5_BH23CHL5_28520 [soil metagenome]
MNVTDFARSYVRWSIPPDFEDQRKPGHLPWGNTVRIQVDACCSVIEHASGQHFDFYLIAPCRNEWMYRELEIVQQPGGEYRRIFSRERQLDVGMETPPTSFAAASVSTDTFSELSFDIAKSEATELTSDSEVVAATTYKQTIVVKTEYKSIDGTHSALLEYPVRTMNFHPERGRFQVDTGPLIFVDFSADAFQTIDRCKLAHIVFNRWDYAEVVCRFPVPTGGSDSMERSLFHYAEVQSLTASHRLFTVDS